MTSRRATVVVLLAALVSSLTLSLPASAAATGRLSGIVEDETGAPFPAARLRLLDATGSTAAQVTADSHGRYGVDIPAGTYQIQVEGQEEGQPVRARIAAFTVEGDTSLDIAMVGGPAHVSRFEGTVVAPDGTPQRQAVVWLDSGRATTTVTDDAGSFHIDIQSGTYALRIEGSSSGTQYYVDNAFDLTGDRHERFVLSSTGGSSAAATATGDPAPTLRSASADDVVTGTVRGRDGAPLPGVYVALGAISYAMPSTGADGRYSLSGSAGATSLNVAWTDGNPSGEYCWYDVDCQGDDYTLAVNGFQAETAPQPLDLTLPPGVFTVRVVDSTGQPVGGAVVNADSTAAADSPGGQIFPGGPVSGHIHSRRITAADGTATVAMIPGHAPVLSVDPPSDRGLPVGLTPANNATSAEVRVPGGVVVRGSISDSDGQQAWFYNAGFVSTDGKVRRPLTVSADRLSYGVVVPAGRYSFWTDTDDDEPGGESDDHRYFDVQSDPFDVTGNTTINFAVPALSAATMSFVDPNGDPIEGDLFVSASTGAGAVDLAPGITGSALTRLGIFGSTDGTTFSIPGAGFASANFYAGAPLELSDLPVRPGTQIVAAMVEGSDLAPPDAPTEVGAGQTGPGTATIHWNPPVNTRGATITGYEITRYEHGAFRRLITAATARSAVINGLVPGESHLFTVAAVTRRGPGEYAGARVTLDNSQPPTTPVPVPGDPPGPTGAPPATTATTAEAHHSGYWALSNDGRVYNFGDAPPLGNASPGAVDLEPTPTGKGYWTLTRNGVVQPSGDAAKLGDLDMGKLAKGETPASLSATPSGKGYWIFTSRGRALAFGDAPFLGDVSTVKLNGPVLGSVVTPTGKGYYMVASDGGIFTFGDARFEGSTGGTKLNAPVQSLVPDSDGKGYWLVASDGGIFAFEAPFKGSLGNVKLNKPIVGMVRYGDGYLMVGADGGIFTFSSLPFSGSLGDKPPSSAVVAVAALPA